MLLGLGLASTLPAGQAPDAQPPEQQAQQGGDAAAPPRPTATLAVITPDAIDCHLVRHDTTCTASITIRPTAAAVGRRLRLVPVLAMPEPRP